MVLPFCKSCGAPIPENAKFCPKCGAAVEATLTGPSSKTSDIIVVTTPTVPGYRITKVFGEVTVKTIPVGVVDVVVYGGWGWHKRLLTPSGEVTVFSTEIEKAKREAIERLKDQARALGANAIVSLDIKTADLRQTITTISATGTAVIVEKEETPTQQEQPPRRENLI